MSINYRPDIDGLRAVAVIPVVLFHAKTPGFSGGFVGVDIFFVISGYLITAILMKELQRNTFSIAQFYHRRIKRIFPAVFTVLIVCTAIAMWLMFSGEFKQFQKSLTASLLFYANYFFMFDVGYFDGPAESKPLLHMWSLAVEEQFYVLFPIYLYAAYKLFRKHVLSLTVFFCISSFIYAIYLTKVAPSDAFFSTPARAWELLLGSILAIIHTRQFEIKKPAAEVLSALGLVAILVAVFGYSSTTKFPGLSAAVPTLGAIFIILSGKSNQTWVGKLLSIKPMVFIGLISFSLYLWHWPLLVFFHKYTLGQGSIIQITWLIAFMVVLSYLSWRYVENPFRKGPIFGKVYKFRFGFRAVTLMLMLGVIVGLVSMSFKRNYPPEVIQILKANTAKNKPIKLENCEKMDTADQFTFEACYLGDQTQKDATFAILGDSHAEMLVAGVEVSAKDFNKKGIFAGSGGCLPFVGTYQVRQGFEICEKRMDVFLKYLESNQNIKQVILISRWAIYAESTRYKNTIGSDVFIKDHLTKNISKDENYLVFERSFIRTLERIKALNVNLTILTQIPESEWSAREIAYNEMIHPDSGLILYKKDYLERQQFVNSVFEKHQSKFNYQIIYSDKVMCPNDKCVLIDEYGTSIYRDNAHITRPYAIKLAGMFDSFFDFGNR